MKISLKWRRRVDAIFMLLGLAWFTGDLAFPGSSFYPYVPDIVIALFFVLIWSWCLVYDTWQINEERQKEMSKKE